MEFQVVSIQGLLCCLAYFLAGIVDSITGGGGLITIPVMMVTGVPVHGITGTNQCASIVGTGVAASKYIKSGNVHMRSALITLPFAVIGSYIGAKLNLLVPEQYLRYFMTASVPVIGVFVLLNKNLGETDRAEEKSPLFIFAVSALIGLVLGGYQGFYGPGGGLFFVLAYSAFLKLNLTRATGNTRFVVCLASLSSVVAYASSGAVIWPLAVPCTLFNIVGSYLGASLAIRKGSRIIRPIMICVVALLLIKLLMDI